MENVENHWSRDKALAVTVKAFVKMSERPKVVQKERFFKEMKGVL